MKWLRNHVFALRLTSLLMMFLIPVLMYSAAGLGLDGLLWLLLAVSAIGAGLLITVK